MKAGEKIKICAVREGGKFNLIVQDNGQGQGNNGTSSERKRKGIGLGNLMERLLLLYKGEAELKLHPLEQGMQVQIQIPLLMSTPYDKEEPHVDHTIS